MSDFTDQYVVQARQVGEDQYESVSSALSNTIRHQLREDDWLSRWSSSRERVRHVINEQDLHTNPFFNVPQTAIETIRSKLVMKIFDEYANTLREIYSTRPFDRDDSIQTQSVPWGPTSPPVINSLETSQSNKVRKGKEGGDEGVTFINLIWFRTIFSYFTVVMTPKVLSHHLRDDVESLCVRSWLSSNPANIQIRSSGWSSVTHHWHHTTPRVFLYSFLDEKSWFFDFPHF